VVAVAAAAAGAAAVGVDVTFVVICGFANIYQVVEDAESCCLFKGAEMG
jgi:hypothetical protein